MTKSAVKAGLKRGFKALGFLAVAGLVTQIPQICGLVPAQLTAVLAVFGLSCASGLAAAGLGLEKALNWKDITTE